jgi:hypothetical protein
VQHPIGCWHGVAVAVGVSGKWLSIEASNDCRCSLAANLTPKLLLLYLLRDAMQDWMWFWA